MMTKTGEMREQVTPCFYCSYKATQFDERGRPVCDQHAGNDLRKQADTPTIKSQLGEIADAD